VHSASANSPEYASWPDGNGVQTILSIRRKHHSFRLSLRIVIFVRLVWRNGHTLVTINEIVPIVNIPCATGVYDLWHAMSSSSS